MHGERLAIGPHSQRDIDRATEMRPRVGQRQFKVRVERSGNDSYTAKIAVVDDARSVVAASGLDAGIIDLVNDLLIEIAREREESPDGHD